MASEEIVPQPLKYWLSVESLKAYGHKTYRRKYYLSTLIPFTAITILYRNTKVKVCSPNRDTEYFDIVAGVLQWDTLALYLFIICLDYMLRTSIDKFKENGFELIKKTSRRYPTKTITDADYADDIAILANAPVQAEILFIRRSSHRRHWTTCECTQNKVHVLQSNRRHFHSRR